MGNRIDDIFSALRKQGRKGLMPFLCGGYPTSDAARDAVPAMDEAGASIIEIGFPFSDPIADGPTIASAMHLALERGVTPDSVLEAVAEVRSGVSAGLVAMVSVSILERIGLANAASKFSQAGIDGVIVPDVPVEESPRVLEPFRSQGLCTSLLVAPTTGESRLAKIAGECSGFVYVMTQLGVTGQEREGLAAGLEERIGQLRAVTDLPLACGFGISSASQVREVVRFADAAIVGSALVRRMGESEAPAEAAGRFVRELADGLH